MEGSECECIVRGSISKLFPLFVSQQDGSALFLEIVMNISVVSVCKKECYSLAYILFVSVAYSKAR